MSNPIAFVLLDHPVTPEPRALVETMRQRHPDLPWDVAGDSATAKPNDALLLRCGGHLVTVMSIPAPVPHDKDLWERASLLWREGREVAGRHRAHLIVCPMGKHENRLESARITTALVGGLIAVTPGCSAVIWRSITARSAAIWLDGSRRAFAPSPDYPFMLWVEILPFRSGQATGATTAGLSAFIDREIEFDVDGMDYPTVIDRVAGLVSYLIGHGAVIKDGDTVGISDADRIKVHFRTSRFNGAPVLAVGPPHAIPGRWKQYPIISVATARDHPLLVMLSSVGLFDPSSPDNQVQLRPDAYESEDLLETYQQGLNGWLSNLGKTGGYVEAEKSARAALARGDVEMAKSVLLSFADEIRKFQINARFALTRGDLFMFLPKQSATRLS
jgi:Domain of unknown function (DUF4261)